MKALIVGGGIGGLTAALFLHRAGLDVEVVEQGRGNHELGVGLNLLPPAVERLLRLGLGARLEATAVRTAELIYAHRLGRHIWSEPRGTDGGSAVPQYSIHRGRLQGLLAAALRERAGAGALRTESRLTGFRADGSGVTAEIHTRAGGPATAHGDVLVAADGIHSAVRSLLFPDEGPPRWSGVTMWRGATDWPPFLTGRSQIIAGGSDAKLVCYPIAAGGAAGTRLTNWAVCVRTGDAGQPPPRRQDWSRPGRPEELAPHLDLFAVAQVDLPALVAATPRFYEFPMCDRDPLPHWSSGPVTLLGDAAHPMYPMGSNGAGQAILDAEALTRHLAGGADVAASLRAYQEERMPLTERIVRSNRRGGPERAIDEVERRAPDGFDRIEDVIEPDELAAIVGGYVGMAGVVRGGADTANGAGTPP